MVFLSLLLILILTSGCSIGVKESVKIVYVSYAKTPEEAQGALRIATNSKIPVTVVGETDTYTELNLGGYYVISAGDLKAFVNAVQTGQ